MNKRAPLIAFGVILVVAGLGAVSFKVASHYLTSVKQSAQVVSCARQGAHHTVTISNGTLSASHTYAKLCDMLTITNDDPQLRVMAFGPHDDHQPYDGVTEQVLSPHESMTVVLDQAGTYRFHDHIDDSIVGYFTVSAQ